MYMRSTRPSPPIFIHKEKAWWGEGGRSWSCTHGCCSESTPPVRESHLSVRKCTYGPLTSKIIVIYIKTSHRRAYYRKVFRNFAPCRFDFTVWFVCVANEAELWRGGGDPSPSDFLFFFFFFFLRLEHKDPSALASPPCRWLEDQRLSARLNEPRVEASALRGRTEHEWGISTNLYSPPLGICKMICGKFV